jgi:signal transduction histidine kinase
MVIFDLNHDMRAEKFDFFGENSDTFMNDETYPTPLFSDEEIRVLTLNDPITNDSILNKERPEVHSFVPDWKILIVDAEKDIVAITKFVFTEYRFENSHLTFFEANNSEEAKKTLIENNDIALIFLGVLMESNYDVLELVRFIREDLENELMQIVLIGREPGDAPEKEIIHNYKINFYQFKSELTENKIFTIIVSLLNTYSALKTIKENSIILKQIIDDKTHDLRVKNEEYKNAILTKNKMFSIIAHDLVNPFNSLLGFSDILRNQCEQLPTEKIKQFSEVIWQTSRSTCDLLSNLLEWSRVQNGKISFSPQKTNLYDLIKSNIELLQLQAQQKKINLTYSCEEGIYIYCDSNMINTVLRNLISNGIKFTSQGGVHISVTVIEEACKIEISDTGIGIASSKIVHLFSPENISMTGTSGESGTGIGLMLCKEFINMNHGQIQATGKLNKGSTFTLTLPILLS